MGTSLATLIAARITPANRLLKPNQRSAYLSYDPLIALQWGGSKSGNGGLRDMPKYNLRAAKGHIWRSRGSPKATRHGTRRLAPRLLPT